MNDRGRLSITWNGESSAGSPSPDWISHHYGQWVAADVRSRSAIEAEDGLDVTLGEEIRGDAYVHPDDGGQIDVRLR